MICGELFAEEWIQCLDYESWVHEDCVELERLADKYACDFCKCVV